MVRGLIWSFGLIGFALFFVARPAAELLSPPFSAICLSVSPAHVLYLHDGIRQGIGFNLELVQLQSNKANMQSSTAHPEVVDSYIQEEL